MHVYMYTLFISQRIQTNLIRLYVLEVHIIRRVYQIILITE